MNFGGYQCIKGKEEESQMKKWTKRRQEIEITVKCQLVE
jgi:hypothetical protein